MGQSYHRLEHRRQLITPLQNPLRDHLDSNMDVQNEGEQAARTQQLFSFTFQSLPIHFLVEDRTRGMQIVRIFTS